jgi:hypothetical protein
MPRFGRSKHARLSKAMGIRHHTEDPGMVSAIRVDRLHPRIDLQDPHRVATQKPTNRRTQRRITKYIKIKNLTLILVFFVVF